MREFYRTRSAKHQNKLLRYLKYVLNDHVVLIGGFIFGGAALYYADVVKTLDSSFVFGKLIVALLWYMSLLAGGLATLIQPADKVFILPKEKQMTGYFKASFFHSLTLPSLLLFLVSGGAMPLLIAVAKVSVVDFVLYFLMLLVLKIAYLFQQGQSLLQNNQATIQRTKNVWFGLSAVAILVSLYLASWFGLALGITCLFSQLSELKIAVTIHGLDWEKMVIAEQQRLKRIYQFINLFTDVPGMSGTVKRRKWFDPLLKKIGHQQKQTYIYLYARSFLRGSEYGQLVLRLTIVGSLMLGFTRSFIVALAISLIVIYLIGFQLLPLYSHFDYMVMTQLYPLGSIEKQQGFIRLIRTILVFVGLIFGIMVMIVVSSWTNKLIVLLAIFFEIVIFSHLYAPTRLRKIEQR